MNLIPIKHLSTVLGLCTALFATTLGAQTAPAPAAAKPAEDVVRLSEFSVSAASVSGLDRNQRKSFLDAFGFVFADVSDVEGKEKGKGAIVRWGLKGRYIAPAISALLSSMTVKAASEVDLVCRH